MQSQATRIEAKPAVATTSHYLTTYLSSGFLLFGGLIILRVANDRLGKVGFDEFILARRFLSAIVPVLSIGLAVSVAKQVSNRVALEGAQESRKILESAYQLSTLCSLLYIAVTLCFSSSLSQIALGTSSHGPLLSVSGLFAWGLLWSICTISYCRGRLWNHVANTLQTIFLAICPLVTMLCVTSPESFYFLAGSILIVANFLARHYVLQSPITTLFHWNQKEILKLVRLGAPRVPGDAAYYGLLAIPAVLAAQVGGLAEGAKIAYGLTVLTLLMQVAAPINQTTLSDATHLLAIGDRSRLRSRIIRATAWVLVATTVGVVLVELLAPTLVWLHMGQDEMGLSTAVRQITPAAIPLNLFLCLRSVVDAAYQKAVVPHLSITAFLVFFVCYFVLKSYAPGTSTISFAFYTATTALSMCTFLATWKVLAKGPSQRALESDQTIIKAA